MFNTAIGRLLMTRDFARNRNLQSNTKYIFGICKQFGIFVVVVVAVVIFATGDGL